jgi:ribonuclease BN (tRNA processing enzyme)
MEVTLLGTGSPIPFPERAGTSIHVECGNEQILIDCGPGAVTRLLENNKPLSEIDSLFFTHQHMDHNADFFNFVISSWSLGRDDLTLYGPAGTDAWLDALESIYHEDLQYRKRMDYPEGGIEGITSEEVDAEFAHETDSWTVAAHPVEHSIETYAYRFTEPSTGATFVFSGDTRYIESLAEFAAGADLLVQDACVAPRREGPPAEGQIWEHFSGTATEDRLAELQKTHCTPEQAGEIAAEAGVDRLVLTHLLPYRDPEGMRRAAAAAFDGGVEVARDGRSIEL